MSLCRRTWQKAKEEVIHRVNSQTEKSNQNFENEEKSDVTKINPTEEMRRLNLIGLTQLRLWAEADAQAIEDRILRDEQEKVEQGSMAHQVGNHVRANFIIILT